MRTRAERRKHEYRIRQKCLNQAKIIFGDNEEIISHKVPRMANNRKLCSCEMCGNPRRYYGEKTIQERKFEAKVKI